jgi:phosphatidylserine/phosphatidylglycerophosphate/cardiolipin synthase-like enzyme
MAKRSAKKQSLPKILKKSTFTAVLTLLLFSLFWITEVAVDSKLPQSNEAPIFYSTQMRDDLKKNYLDALKGAKKSILLMTYTLKDSAILNLLKKKADEGIEVTVIYDLKASENAHQKLGKKVKLVKRGFGGLMHQKILVVDKTQVWIGSANITNDSLRVHGNMVVGMHSDALGKMIETKAASMQSKNNDIPFPSQEFLLKEQKMEFWLLPDNPHASKKILDLIRTAKKTIRVAMFTWTRQDFAAAVIQAYNRGVDVQVVLDYHSACGASVGVANQFLAAKVPLWFNQGNGLLHYKMMVVDGKVLVNGSANWTKAAFTKNDDCFMVLHDLSPEQQQWLEELWNVIILEGMEAKCGYTLDQAA